MFCKNETKLGSVIDKVWVLASNERAFNKLGSFEFGVFVNQ